MTTYSEDSEGKYIPASQRPDGTWRKARRVKDGYVPQEEVPLYESKGKIWAKKPLMPVGMCPVVPQKSKDMREKEQKPPIPGLLLINKNPATGGAKAKAQKSTTNPNAKKPPEKKPAGASSIDTIGEQLNSVHLEQDPARKLKKLRRKIREIEVIEAKLKMGELKNPEKDQLDKVARKAEIAREIAELEEQASTPE
ncbi:Partner of Y14 and mago [Sergentomyia squamirostris]